MKYFFYFLFFFISLSCFSRTSSTNLDFKVFHQASVRLVSHQSDFYDFRRDQIFTYKYSPIFPLMTAPLGYFPEATARKIWAAINMLALPIAWFFLTKIFLILTKTTEINYSNMVITLLLLAQPITNNATQGNINTILLAFLAAAFYLSLKEKKVLAGIISAIGFSIKLTPGVIFIYFFAYKKWKELFVAMITSFIFLIVIPVLYFGFQETIDLYLGWKTVLSDTTHFPFFKYTNQSPLVVMAHWQGMDSINFVSKLFYYAVNLLMLGSFYYFYKRKNVVVFIAFTFMFLLTAAPVVWMEYYLFLIFPYLVVHQWLVTGLLSKSSKYLWYFKLVVAHLLVKFIIGNHYSDIVAYNGRSLIGLFILGIIFLIEEKRASA